MKGARRKEEGGRRKEEGERRKEEEKQPRKGRLAVGRCQSEDERMKVEGGRKEEALFRVPAFPPAAIF
jgi:hypothetical protein